MRGRRPEQVKAWLARAAAEARGRSFSALSAEPGMELLSPEIEVFYGVDSLARPRRQRAPVDLAMAPPPEIEAEEAVDEIRRRNLNVLTPQRAARFVERFLPEKGAKISTAEMHLALEDDLLDLLAALAFDRGPSSGTHKHVRWRVHAAREDFGTEPERIPRDSEAGRVLERFTLERIA
jgi:hypothetical protein